ncbi:hypothetical protein Poli38472_001846 [Pythium oligandrum]|uniref:Uncharacterized protein n=1 Tax=Pythium oligandrum TaxID=41045 RepID=A0A8K1FMS4_PYTOL|nr:hypothetical protein Poli38472_001846 [Pythium oligandrum]|eukprot:TMW69690.1 hypothetical protein Poli38472_001846 [Pythium oligandrum]
MEGRVTLTCVFAGCEPRAPFTMSVQSNDIIFSILTITVGPRFPRRDSSLLYKPHRALPGQKQRPRSKMSK